MWDRRCPAGHAGPFTCYGLAIYSCHQCSSTGDHKFVLRAGRAVWTDPDKVPDGLQRKAAEREKGKR